VDLTRLDLAPEEGQLAARLDGPMSVDDIAAMMGWEAAHTERVVQRLVEKRALIRQGEQADEQGANGQAASDPYRGFEFPAPLMNAACDLTEEERKRIIWTYGQLDQMTYYDLLQAKRRDDAAEVSRKYKERSKEWHPDRWRRELGPFKRMIDEVFKRVQLARKTLSDPRARAEYDEQVAHLIVDEDDLAEMRAEQRRRTRDLFRQKESLERRRRRNPIIKNLDKARQQAVKAEELEEKGQMVEALRAAQMALTFDERNPTYREMVDRLSDKAAESRIELPMRRGRSAESMAKWEEAIHFFEEAVRLAPKMPEAKKRLAYNLLMGGRDPHEALNQAAKAVEGLPRDPEAHYIAGLCYEKADMNKAAVRALSRAVELKSNYAEAKKRLRNLRWGF
jgi:tetratricopeptide (TPR) repeat protein